MTTDVVALHIGPRSVCARRGDDVAQVPAVAAHLGNGYVFGSAATALEVIEVFDPDPDVDRADLAAGVLCHAASTVGAGPETGTAVVIHPTRWSAPRRGMLCTAARRVARNAELLPVAVAAYRAVTTAPHERCVVLETAADTTVVAVAVADGEAPTITRVTRDPYLAADDLATDAGAQRLAELIGAVTGPVDPDVVIVTGVPGEPSGTELCARIGELLGRGIRVAPVAAAEMLAAVTDPEAAAGIPLSPRSPHSWAAPPSPPSPAQWLRTVREPRPERPEPPRRRPGVTAAVAVAVAAAVAALVAAAVIAVPGRGPGGPGAVAAPDARAGSAARAGADAGAPVRSAVFDLGGVRLELPEQWRLRDPGSVGTGRVELLPGSGADRRIVVVHSRLAEGTDTSDVARTLARLAEERAGVIRDLNADTTFADRPVIAYTEVPDEFSSVRWSVVVTDGVQVAVGCQFLDGEWVGIRSECEQAVHTVDVT